VLTPEYASPEQLRGESLTPASDVYSLGVVLYEMLCGRPPFSGDSPVAVAYKHVQEPPRPPRELTTHVPEPLEAVTMKALAKNPANRYRSAEEFRQDLERVRLGQPVGATPLLPQEAPTQVIAPSAAAPVEGAGRTSVLPPQPPAPEPPRRRWWVGVVVGLLILAALGAGAYILASGLLGGGEPGATTFAVPNVFGDKLPDATAKLQEAGFKVRQPVIRQEDPNHTPGTVIKQDPAADTQMPKGTEITLTVAKAPPVQIPTGLIGHPADEVKATLEGLGLTVDPQEQSSTDVEKDHVISLDPGEGQTIKAGGTVTMVVSTGPGQVHVPDLVCQPLGKAQTDLTKEGLDSLVAQGTQFNAECPQPGKVAATEPGAGTPVEAGTVITLIESTNVSPTPSPSESPTP
jgi:serine/threonine-protein kinase